MLLFILSPSLALPPPYSPSLALPPPYPPSPLPCGEMLKFICRLEVDIILETYANFAPILLFKVLICEGGKHSLKRILLFLSFTHLLIHLFIHLFIHSYRQKVVLRFLYCTG